MKELTLLLFYKNTFYKNIKAQICEILRIFPREARFIISSRAKRACITRASQGQRDFLLAINLSSLVGVRLYVMQSSDVRVHYGSPGNRLPSMRKLRVLFMKTRFFICEL